MYKPKYNNKWVEHNKKEYIIQILALKALINSRFLRMRPLRESVLLILEPDYPFAILYLLICPFPMQHLQSLL